MLPILTLVLSVLATLYLVDDAYQSYLERAPLREFVFKALCATSALVLSVALWLALYLA
jgi:hypothetical protein